jgi:hypothetical protein
MRFSKMPSFVASYERALEVDHITPRNKGGADEIANLQALCFSCNAMKRDRDDTDFRAVLSFVGVHRALLLGTRYPHFMGNLAPSAFHSPGGDRVTADHRCPSLHHPTRYTTRANSPRNLPRAPCARPYPLANYRDRPKIVTECARQPA